MPDLLTLEQTWNATGYLRGMDKPGVCFLLRAHVGPNTSIAAIIARISALLPAWQPAINTMDENTAANAMAQVFATLTLAIERIIGAEVQSYSIMETSEPDQIRVCIAREDAGSAFHAGWLALSLINECEILPATLAEHLAEFMAYAAPRRLDTNARAIAQAARRMGIPAFDLEQEPFASTRPHNPIQHGLFQLGLCASQHRILAAMPQGSAAKVKPVHYQRHHVAGMLRLASIPAPTTDIEFPNKNRFNRIQRAVDKIGYPVVLKRPASGEFHDALPVSGAVGPIHTPEQLVAAYETGFQAGHIVWVESFLTGSVFRYLVMSGQVVSVVELEAAVVTGDGVHSLQALIAEQIAHASTQDEKEIWTALSIHPLSRLKLLLQGYSEISVPEAGASIWIDFPSVAHTRHAPSERIRMMPHAFIELAERSAASLALDFAGIDIVIVDPAGPAATPNCAVLAVKPEPDLAVHARALGGNGARYYERLIHNFLPTRAAATVPCVAVTGTNGKTTTTRMLASMFRHAGKCTGLACSDGVYVDHALIASGDLAGAPGSMMLFPRKEIESLALESSRGGLIKFGRPFERCDVGVCLNVAADHLNEDGIENLDQLAEVKRVVVEHCEFAAVLNADDPRCLAMLPYVSAPRILLFSGRAPEGALANHLARGGEAVYSKRLATDNETLCHYDGSAEHPVIAVADIPATHFGRARHNVENAAAAIAAGLGLGLDRTAIIGALGTFAMNFENTPSRMNELTDRPYRILMDAAHNLHGMRALMTYLDQEITVGKRILVAGPSSRFTEDEIRQMAKLLAPRFDRFICKRYRPFENHSACIEPWRVLHDGLIEQGIQQSAVTIEEDAKLALDNAISELSAGDFLVVLVPAARSLESGIWEEIIRLTS